MPQPARRPCGARTRPTRDASREVDSGASASIIQLATATTTTAADKGQRTAATPTSPPVAPGRTSNVVQPSVRCRHTNPLSLEPSTSSGVSARGGRALRKGRDVARVCACGALAAGVRCGIARGVPPQVMQRAVSAPRSKARGAGSARAPASIPQRRAPPRRRRRCHRRHRRRCRCRHLPPAIHITPETDISERSACSRQTSLTRVLARSYPSAARESTYLLS